MTVQIPPRTAWTADALLARTTDDAGCLIWQGSISSGGSPRVHMDNRMHAVRKLLLLWVRGVTVSPRHKVATTCGTRGCVHPDHLNVVTLASHARNVMTPRTNHLLKAAKIAQTRRARHAVLSEDDVRELRASDEPAEIAAERLGVSAKHIDNIRARRVWREHTASPWAGMGAR